MPPWGQELTDEQIRDVVYYLSVIRANSKTAANK
jgi:mono/diheme cytochrome c family protein